MERKEQAEDRVPRSPSKAENPANSTNTFHEFRWAYGGSQVRVTGDFMGWGEGLKMTRAPDGAFYLTCTLPADQMIKYKVGANASTSDYGCLCHFTPPHSSTLLMGNGKLTLQPQQKRMRVVMSTTSFACACIQRHLHPRGCPPFKSFSMNGI